MIFSRIGSARQGMARPGAARQHVTQYGNWDNFLKAPLGGARHGRARRGKARQHACRWAVSLDTFGKQKQGNQSKTT